ncbi:MAG: hypothetical protein NC818_07395 [Candidatus Omnitrophica bacterium]|nr:hypothetical protein [Candidatus Omnitrophota bacterium]
MEFEVKTGYGYFRDKYGNIAAKAELPRGIHLLKDGYIYCEVDSQEDLEKIQVYIPLLTKEEIEERKIKTEADAFLREQAIQRLKARGEIK